MSQQDQFIPAPRRSPTVEADVQRLVEPKRRWPHFLGRPAFGLGDGGRGLRRGELRRDRKSDWAGTPARAEAAADPALPDSPFLQQRQAGGCTSLLEVFPVLGQVLTNGTKFGVKSSWNDQAADKYPMQALVGMDYATTQYNGPAAGVIFAAPTGSACEGTMVRVVPFAKPCASVPAMLPPNSKISDNLGQFAVYVSAASPTGDRQWVEVTCVFSKIMKYDVRFRWGMCRRCIFRSFWWG
jgi:hypothetical protein